MAETSTKAVIPGNHEKISYTAIGVAYARTFSDIPYSKEIAEMCDAALLTKENAEMHRKLAPYFEARFKALSNLLAKSGVKNILEIASGAGPRDLLLTQDPSITYIETDLPDMLATKRQILERLVGEHGVVMPRNLELIELNALDALNFAAVVDRFPEGPLAIGHEGLMAYFTHEEKAETARIIRQILIKRGGVWITPDLNTWDNVRDMTDARAKEVVDQVLKNTGRDYQANTFADRAAIAKFFNDLGFDATSQTIGEAAGEIVSARQADLDPEKVRAQLAVNIWEFRAKQ